MKIQERGHRLPHTGAATGLQERLREAEQRLRDVEERYRTELRDRERELTEALEQQTATSDILRVISRSPNDAQPVFETIVRHAVALCGSLFANVFRFDGEWLHFAASHNTGQSYVELLRSKYPMRPDTSQVSGRVVLTRSMVVLEDARADPDYDQRFPVAMGWRRMLGVPMLSDGKLLGVIVVGWAESGPVPKMQEELLRTFADQAVIAIENVRLFKELGREIEAHRKSKATIQHLVEESRFDRSSMIGKSLALRRVREQIAQVAPTDSTVLIQGETGTGKELVARAIHDLSKRSDHPLIKINCAALPRELVESELFGHEKGAFTGAVQQRRGRFELADGGTLFLDEVGELPLEAQAKLLRVLQEHEFERVGGTRSLRTDVRLIAATNRDLQGQVRTAQFRSDLYYRLNVFPIVLPPLRERREDIPSLVQHFATKVARKLGRILDGVSPAFIERARAYDWPGNIRELENLIERALITRTDGVLDASDLFASSASQSSAVPASVDNASLEEVERAHIRHVLQGVRWKIEGENGAARILGLKPSTLRARMRKLGISKTF